eukprot:c796_g1_i1.p1 GENE.c796_g1_i1~~c796_g1_i1.p1  ORF type:complete len:419 (+),score=159.50 c796_g1_i1:29-1285(+)
MIILIFFISLITTTCSTTEESDLGYVIEFYDSALKPLDKETLSSISEWIPMTNYEGKEYNCSLPVVKSKQSREEEASKEPKVNINKVFQSLDGQCIFRNEGWWTYEFCFKQRIRQFHVEGKKLVAEFFLGLHDAVKSQIKKVESPSSLKTDLPRYAIEMFDGTVCDLTNKRRKSIIIFECGKQFSLESILELVTCEYQVSVKVPALCDGEAKAKEQSLAPINCYAIDIEQIDKEEGKNSISEQWKKAISKDLENGNVEIQAALYKVGQTFRHLEHKYRGVIVAHDPVCLQTESWIKQMSVDKLRFGRNQPFYHALVDERDRPGSQVTYVAQEHIKIETFTDPPQHTHIDKIFSSYVDGQFIPRGDIHISLVPVEESSEAVGDILKQLAGQDVVTMTVMSDEDAEDAEESEESERDYSH